MRTRIPIACACVIVGLGAIVAVASTAGPPDGYRVFAQRDVRAYLPDSEGFRTVISGQPDVFVAAGDNEGNAVQVAGVPARGRSMAQYERFTLENIEMAAPSAENLRREDVDVPGADEARRITFTDPDREDRVTTVIARDGDRFVTLTVDALDRTPDDVLDTETVEDSFAITG